MKKVVAHLLLAISLIFIYSSVILSLFYPGEIKVTKSLLLSSFLVNFILMFCIPLIFIYLVYGGGLKNVMYNLYFRKENAGRAILYGIISCLLFIFISSLILYYTGYSEESQLAEELRKNIDIYILFLLPILSALTEETFYRGLIQMQIEKKVGISSIIISSILFATAHLQYRSYLQTVMSFSFGILLGFLIYKERNILAPLSAHFTFNFISLLVYMI